MEKAKVITSIDRSDGGTISICRVEGDQEGLFLIFEKSLTESQMKEDEKIPATFCRYENGVKISGVKVRLTTARELLQLLKKHFGEM